MPTKIVWGRLEEEIKKAVDFFSVKNLLLITSGQAIKSAGITDKTINALVGYNIRIFDKVEANPSPQIVKKAKINCDLVIGLGGGSAMDVAKIVAHELKKPCIEIPTTAGTGSEVTPFAALYDKEKKKKMSLTPGFADVALVDWKLSKSMPKELTASTGLDALSQAVEAYWNINSNPLSDLYAEKAITTIIANLKNSFNGSESAIEAMSLASLKAGLAFSQTKTTAPHSVSYPLTIFYGVPHGLACALTLPHFLMYNYKVTEADCLDKRGPKFVEQRIEKISKFLGAKNPLDASKMISKILKSLNMPQKINFDLELVLKNSFSKERMGNNPREVTEEKLSEILKKIKK